MIRINDLVNQDKPIYMHSIEVKASNIIRCLNEKGWIYITDQSEQQLNEILHLLGKVIYTTDVVVKTESKGMITSANGLDFHTDHHKAKYVAWYCHNQTNKGGDSILVDAKKVYNLLPIEQQKELEKIDLFEHTIFPDDKASNPLVTIDDNGIKFYYSFWLVKDDDKNNIALCNFHELIKQTTPISINLKPSDILIVDNHRILHGRTPIEGTKDRHLKRYWLI